MNTSEKILAKLAAGDKLREAATPGEWRLHSMGYTIQTDKDTPHDGDYLDVIASVSCGPRATEKALRQFQNDGFFIAIAHNTHAPMSNALKVAVRALENIDTDHCDEITAYALAVRHVAREALAKIAAEMGCE